MLNSNPYFGRDLMEEYKTRQTQKTQKIGILIKAECLGVTSINKPFCGNRFQCKPSPEKMEMVPDAQLLTVEVCIQILTILQCVI